MQTKVTADIFRLVHKARAAYQESKNAHHGIIENAEETINRLYRGKSEELNAMADMNFLRMCQSHVYIRLD